MKLIALCGMPGSGKSTVRSHMEEVLGVPAWYVGQPLLEECNRAGVDPSYANRMKMGSRLGLFDPSDPLKFIKFSVEKMKSSHPDASAICFDSIRSPNELKFLRAVAAEVTVVAVLLERSERFRRLHERDGVGCDDFEIRDHVEVGLSNPFERKFEVGQLIALADHYILSPAGNRTTSLGFQLEEVLARLGISTRNCKSSHHAMGLFREQECHELEF